MENPFPADDRLNFPDQFFFPLSIHDKGLRPYGLLTAIRFLTAECLLVSGVKLFGRGSPCSPRDFKTLFPQSLFQGGEEIEDIGLAGWIPPPVQAPLFPLA